MEKIDFVITWVDGNDKKWIKEKNKYKPNGNIDNRVVRYRDWENLKYWFRGVEKFAPWVNKIYFITYGHLPNWLNLNNPKLVVVKHSDYMDERNLPTFNSVPIELSMHKIKGLSENFVYFNDDMFLTSETKPTDFFKDNIPCDAAILKVIVPSNDDGFDHTLVNNTYIINKYFNMKEVIRKNIFKWFNFKYGKQFIKTFIYSFCWNFPAIKQSHIPVSYKKTTFEKVWNLEKTVLEEVSTQRFRNNYLCVNHFLMQNWQLVTGNFKPRSLKFGTYFGISSNNEKIIKAIKNKKYKSICINDTEKIDDFEKTKKEINDAFDTILPEKSSFEL